jgi:hypothetical protein
LRCGGELGKTGRKPCSLGTYEEAVVEAEQLNARMGSVNRTVEYFPKEMEAVPEEAPSFGMEMRL